MAYDNCAVKSIVVHGGQVFIALVHRTRGTSEIVCPNTQQKIEVPGSIEHMVVRCPACPCLAALPSLHRLRLSCCL